MSTHLLLLLGGHCPRGNSGGRPHAFTADVAGPRRLFCPLPAVPSVVPSANYSAKPRHRRQIGSGLASFSPHRRARVCRCVALLPRSDTITTTLTTAPGIHIYPCLSESHSHRALPASTLTQLAPGHHYAHSNEFVVWTRAVCNSSLSARPIVSFTHT
jgi:hypothetical protein